MMKPRCCYVFFLIRQFHTFVNTGDGADDVDSYEEVNSDVDHYSGDAMYIDGARYEFLHIDSDDSGDVLAEHRTHVMMLATHDLKRSLKLILPRLQVASMTYIFNAFLNGNLNGILLYLLIITPRHVTSRLRARPVKAVAAAKYQTVVATDGAEFFTWVSKQEMENLLSKKSVKDALGVGDIDFDSSSHVVYQTMIMDWLDEKS
ncbi:hypothetical protein L1987_54257 [Smallanthus sonchifolius]|uniref:Uncharacterized protein n=1 Tax=Smallanthus sonchifolius TaxID=185202 RepID=A0ACB9E7A8_9ASTR|nr:hypothetical protein L1987_54257 [Smallanthus sonchifolius]